MGVAVAGKSTETVILGDDPPEGQEDLVRTAGDLTEDLMKKVEVEVAIRDGEYLPTCGAEEGFREAVRELQRVAEEEAEEQVAFELAKAVPEPCLPGYQDCPRSSHMVASWKWRGLTGPAAGNHKGRETVEPQDSIFVSRPEAVGEGRRVHSLIR